MYVEAVLALLPPPLQAAAALLPLISILAGRPRGDPTGSYSSEVKPEPSPSEAITAVSSAAAHMEPVTTAPEVHRYHGTRVPVNW